MRLRNLKNKEEIINNSEYIVKNPEKYINSWHKLFKNNNEIFIEIGMGRGKFIIENAKTYPNINFIGIEKQNNILARCLKDIEKNIPNLKLISVNAMDIDNIFNKEIDRIYLNFSDPWPKKRQNKRRLTSKIFLEKYEKIFKNKKEIYLRTDNEELFIYSIETLSSFGYKLTDITFNLHNNHDEFLITTEYEDKFTGLGLQIYSLKASK